MIGAITSWNWHCENCLRLNLGDFHQAIPFHSTSSYPPIDRIRILIMIRVNIQKIPHLSSMTGPDNCVLRLGKFCFFFFFSRLQSYFSSGLHLLESHITNLNGNLADACRLYLLQSIAFNSRSQAAYTVTLTGQLHLLLHRQTDKLLHDIELISLHTKNGSHNHLNF